MAAAAATAQANDIVIDTSEPNKVSSDAAKASGAGQTLRGGSAAVVPQEIELMPLKKKKAKLSDSEGCEDATSLDKDYDNRSEDELLEESKLQ